MTTHGFLAPESRRTPGPGPGPVVSPDRTYAFVAGVERYAVSPGWNLRGAARDAIRFADWLTGPCEVPPDNVSLLLSPLDPAGLDWPATPALAELRSAHRPATEESVKTALFSELPQRDGDLLWIFWAGHGFLGTNREMILPCSDAHAGEIRHLNLDSALRWWRTDRVRSSRFSHQAALVDACRVDVPPQGRLNFGTVDYGGGATQAGRRQFRLYASREGEAAKNDAERSAGQFTDALLDELARRPHNEGANGLAETGRALHHHFQELRRAHRGWQLPQFVVDRDWDECSFLDDELPPAPKAARLDQAGWDGLGELFAQQALPRYTYDAYAWAFKAAGCTTPVLGGLPGDTLLDVVQDLDDRQGGRADIPLAVPFVRFLADRARSANPDWSAGLTAWVERTGQRLGVPALPPPPPPPRDSALHIRLDPAATDEDAFLVRIWLRRGSPRAIWQSEGRSLDLDGVRAELVRQLTDVARTLSAGTDADEQYPAVRRIEFHVPFELLDTPFEQWLIPSGRAGRTRQLGLLYEVVVRCPDERQDLRAAAAWASKWRWLRTQGGRHPKAVRAVAEAEVTDALGPELGSDVAPACVLVAASGARTTDVFDALLEGGVPAAVWRSNGGPVEPAGDPSRELAALLAPDGGGIEAIDVLALPATVRQLRVRQARNTGGPGDGEDRVAVLWDDPDCTMDHQNLA